MSRGDWRRLNALMESTDGEVPLAEPFRSHTPANVGGVYCLLGAPPITVPSRVRDVLYVGKTSCLSRRFSQHLTGKRGVREVKAVFTGLHFVWWCREEPDRSHLEDLLIRCFGPLGNRQYAIRATFNDPVSVSEL